MNTRGRILPIVAAVLWTACGESTAPVAGGGSITLSAQQAATVMARITQLAPVHPELAWLADSISVVLKAGVEVDIVGFETDRGTGPFYAIALQRTISTFANNSASFDVILFNNPSNPTDFIIAGGWSQSSATALPTSVTGSFASSTGSSGVTAHLFQVAGGTVTAWRAATGTASFTSGAQGGACPLFTPPSGVTCSTTDLHASFVISSALRDTGPSDPRSATLTPVDVRGILLRFLVP